MIEQVGITNNKAEQVAPNDTIYLCNFRVSVDGEWLCLKVKNHFYFSKNIFFCPLDITRQHVMTIHTVYIRRASCSNISHSLHVFVLIVCKS